MQRQLEEMIREKKEKSYELKTLTTKIVSQEQQTTNEKRKEISRRHSNHYRGLHFKWYYTGAIEQERTCC